MELMSVLRAPWWRFWAIYLLAGLEAWAIWRNWPWFLPFTVYVLVPLLDLPERNSWKPSAETALFRLPLTLWLPVQTLVILLLSWRVARISPAWAPLQTFLWALSLGIVMALGINVAHELNHKMHVMYRLLARCLLIMAGYGPYAVEHNRGHHKNVGLAHDPATARPGESFYRFLPRAVRGVVMSPRTWPDARERILLDTLAYGFILQLFAFACTLPWPATETMIETSRRSRYVHGLMVYLIGSAFGVFQLELVNYVEHYGLQRMSPEEPVTAQHSWNNHHWLSGCLLFKLEYHSDHHLHAARWYSRLENRPEEWPQHPAGLPAMMLLALVPPLWMAVMDPRAKRIRTATASIPRS
ncbi:similar to alkane 1-monooxygenase [Cyanidioschyzon merolae strain 10D]|jgi:alkane 1-monooxygenase|uniref:Similar to alkane 1-monooxygenase n=1 Tax=Cyanidioschyzon merolae (strain NIES-3377 / 10D) TaxID=280699 RepID=M1VKZ1_CYAM1|nr:similar to alkane 1-monooxygenase [Cyanidioschyzon merolae strain 10D]BAM82273.1 similar to alkane 1-monooxygenase [Cyanidioschyzon merolae strain 10D]|eukprot:XP_005538309.1 similar to alkane 1-monooxygenase [Cyanidioschyzon merolae strain 10D]